MPTALLIEQFHRAGGTLAQYKAGLRFALEADWLVTNQSGDSVQFGEAGIVLYS